MEQQPEEKVVVNVQQAPVGKMNGLCITSFVLALMGMMLCLLPIISIPLAVIALILGIIGIKGANRRGEGGKALGIWGVVLSSIGVLVGIIMTIFVVFVFAAAGAQGFDFKKEIETQMAIESAVADEDSASYKQGYADGEKAAQRETASGRPLKNRENIEAQIRLQAKGTAEERKSYIVGYGDGYESVED